MNAHTRRIDKLERQLKATFAAQQRSQRRKEKHPFDWQAFERMLDELNASHPGRLDHIPRSTWDGFRRYLHGDEPGKTNQEFGKVSSLRSRWVLTRALKIWSHQSTETIRGCDEAWRSSLSSYQVTVNTKAWASVFESLVHRQILGRRKP